MSRKAAAKLKKRYRVPTPKQAFAAYLKDVPSSPWASPPGTSLPDLLEAKRAIQEPRDPATGKFTAEPLRAPSIPALLDQADLALDRLEGKLQRVLRPEPEAETSAGGDSEVARRIAGLIEALVVLGDRVDL